MIFPLSAGEQLGDIVVTESPAQSHGTRFCAIGPRGRRIQDRIKSDPQGGVDHLLERLAEFFAPRLALAATSGSSVNVVLMMAL